MKAIRNKRTNTIRVTSFYCSARSNTDTHSYAYAHTLYVYLCIFTDTDTLQNMLSNADEINELIVLLFLFLVYSLNSLYRLTRRCRSLGIQNINTYVHSIETTKSIYIYIYRKFAEKKLFIFIWILVGVCTFVSYTEVYTIHRHTHSHTCTYISYLIYGLVLRKM